jgi:3-oxoacyl-[acyl-carrier protein] reductase
MSSPHPVVVITGGASGVGAACAELMASKGYDVLINYNRSAESAQTVVELCRKHRVDAIAVQGNIADNSVCVEIASQAMTRWGRIDALVNSAGATRFIPMGDLDAVNAEDFHNIYAINAIGPFQMSRAVARQMQQGSSIVNVSSIAGQIGSGSSYPYVLSKAALNSLTLALARNLAPKIRVNAVLPGMITGRWMLEGLGPQAYERVKEQFSQTSLLGQVATPEHIAQSIAWLLEPNNLMTGQLMVVDAGASLGRPPAAAGK